MDDVKTDIQIEEAIKGGTVRAIASKSEAHRLLICAALAERETFISCPERSGDIDSTIACLSAMGASFSFKADGFYVKPLDKSRFKPDLACGESGSTLRFLLPVCGALGLALSFHMGGRLPMRPLSPLIEEMSAHGCTLSAPGTSPLSLGGRLKSGTYTLPGNVSSQFISGLLFALPLLEGESVIRVKGVMESRPYVDMTLDSLGIFGIKVNEEAGQIFRVQGGQSFCSPGRTRAYGDWSNAAFWLSMGAIGKGPVSCTGLDPCSRQGDRAILGLLKAFGASVRQEGDTVTVSPAPLRGIEIDASDIPDLVPVLSALACAAEGETVIRNAGRLRIKESDRLDTVRSSLTALGADIRETVDGLIIRGRKSLPGGATESYGDHRIAMTAAVLSAVCSGPVLIRNAQAVKKSYPGFFDDFAKVLGGVLRYI